MGLCSVSCSESAMAAIGQSQGTLLNGLWFADHSLIVRTKNAIQPSIKTFMHFWGNVLHSLFLYEFLCWIHFCPMPSCKWHLSPTNRKFQNGCYHRTSVIHIFVIFAFNCLVWSHWYVEINLRCIVWWAETLRILITRYVIEIVGSSPTRYVLFSTS